MSRILRRVLMSALEGKTYLVTGSTDGIGRHTVKRLAEERGRVIVHGRNRKRVDDTVKEVIQETGNSNVRGYVYDLSSLKQIRQFAGDLRRDHDRIDVFINNAGVFEQSKKLSEDGLELTWAVNVVAPYMLLCLMLDMITERVINVSSLSAANGIDFDNLQQEKGYSAHHAYSLSKLCDIMITFSLAREMQSASDVTVNCLCPGSVNTKMLLAGWGSCGIPVHTADNVYFLATDPSVENITGEYFVSKQIYRPPSIARDEDIQRRLIDVLRTQTNEILDASKARPKT